jgi:hypothetical protein
LIISNFFWQVRVYSVVTRKRLKMHFLRFDSK